MAVIILTGITLLLWSVSTVLLFIPSKEKTNLWYGLYLFVASLGLPVAILKEYIFPTIRTNIVLLGLTTRLLSAVSFRFSPYLIMRAGLSYSELFSPKWKSRLSHLLLIPVLLTFILDFIFPKHGFFSIYLDYSPLFWTVSIWAVPYGLCANFLFFHAYYSEQNIRVKRQKLLVLIVTLPSLILLFISYVSVLSGSHDFWPKNLGPFLLIAIIFLVFVGKYGILGLKITFERKQLDNTTILVTSGMAILNHSVKNEVEKINFCARRLKKSPLREWEQSSQEAICVILNSTGHLLEMVARIHKKTQEIMLKENFYNLQELLASAANSVDLFSGGKKIKITKSFFTNPVLKCDGTHLREVFSNIIKNAVESIESVGEIKIETGIDGKYVVTKIKDNGVGIAKENLPHVLEPFFTTKKSSLNIGLGLMYCHNIMQKHGGTLEIDSQESIGTTVILKFPCSKVSKQS